MSIIPGIERDFARITRRIKALEDGSELARAQVDLEQKMEAVLAEMRLMQHAIDEFPSYIQRFAEEVAGRLKGRQKS